MTIEQIQVAASKRKWWQRKSLPVWVVDHDTEVRKGRLIVDGDLLLVSKIKGYCIASAGGSGSSYVAKWYPRGW